MGSVWRAGSLTLERLEAPALVVACLTSSNAGAAVAIGPRGMDALSSSSSLTRFTTSTPWTCFSEWWVAVFSWGVTGCSPTRVTGVELHTVHVDEPRLLKRVQLPHAHSGWSSAWCCKAKGRVSHIREVPYKQGHLALLYMAVIWHLSGHKAAAHAGQSSGN